MNGDLVVMAVLAGAANWAFRALPTMLLRREPRPGGLAARFLSATGPAAIATLVVASLLPQVSPDALALVPLAAGLAATVAAYLPRRSVVAGTLAGAFAYGAVFGLMAG